jgi:hypothetical protein
VTRTGADIAGATHGNITDIQVGTVATAYRPSINQNWNSAGDNEWVCGYVASSGGIFLAHLFPNRDFNTGRWFIFTLVWMS